MSRNIWVISDTHWNHENILRFTDTNGKLIRGSLFDNIEEMNQCIFDNWNDTVKQGDIVYHLGDVYFKKWDTRINALPGKKRLILGNHDDCRDTNFDGVFSKISLWRVLCHFI
jgi:calcineurin-like phosphoesterase family protein